MQRIPNLAAGTNTRVNASAPRRTKPEGGKSFVCRSQGQPCFRRTIKTKDRRIYCVVGRARDTKERGVKPRVYNVTINCVNDVSRAPKAVRLPELVTFHSRFIFCPIESIHLPYFHPFSRSSYRRFNFFSLQHLSSLCGNFCTASKVRLYKDTRRACTAIQLQLHTSDNYFRSSLYLILRDTMKSNRAVVTVTRLRSRKGDSRYRWYVLI